MTDATKLPPPDLTEIVNYRTSSRAYSVTGTAYYGSNWQEGRYYYSMETVEAAIAAARAPLLAEIEALRKRAEDAELDAARYRWLRSDATPPDMDAPGAYMMNEVYCDYPHVLLGVDLDAAIDTAIKGTAA